MLLRNGLKLAQVIDSVIDIDIDVEDLDRHRERGLAGGKTKVSISGHAVLYLYVPLDPAH